MTVQITWHLIVMIVITVLIIVQIGRDLDNDGLDLSFALWGLILVVIWAVYGGIVWW